MAEKTAEWIDQRINLSDQFLKEEMGLEKSTGNGVEKTRETKTLFRRMSVMNNRSNFKNFSFAVFALGSTAYPKFCAFGKWLDLALRRLDGTRLAPVGLGDELGDMDGEFNRWMKTVYQKACMETGIQGHDSKKGEAKVSRWRVVTNVMHDGGIENVVKGLTAVHRQKIVAATLTRKTVFLSKFCRSVLLNLEIMGNPTAVYQPGDHMAVFPVNSDEDVTYLMKHMSGLPDDPKKTVVQLQDYKDGKGWESTSTGLPCTTLFDLFKHHLCLRTVPSMELLEFLSRRAANPIEKVELTKIATDYNAYKEWRQGWPSIVDLIKQFPSIQVDSADLATQLPILQPRFYSIASSLDYICHKKSSEGTPVDLFVHVIDYCGPNGENRMGFCSGFLHGLKEGDEIAIYLREEENFHLPHDHLNEIPLIFVAAGSGIAPIRSFWQQKQFQHEKFNESSPIQLFFGCQDEESDFLKEEICQLEETMVKKYTAYSRMEHKPKEYVQDQVCQNGQQIFTDIILRQGRIYVCGQVTMAEAVNAELVKIIAKFGRVSTQSAAAILNRMKDEKRYCEDIFGQ